MSDPTGGALVPGKEPASGRRKRRPNGRKRFRKRKTPQSESVLESAQTSTGVTDEASDFKSGKPAGFGNNSGKGQHSKEYVAVRAQRPLYAALDLGTNNCRLLIAAPQKPGRFRVVDGFSRIVRLGEGLGNSGQLSDEAMDRAIEALKICAEKLQFRELKNQRLIATEACRQASNGDHFLKRVQDEAGIELEILSREMEAKLAASGCGSLMDRRSDGAVLFDIGGGSSELILVDRSINRRAHISEQIAAWTSLPMGVVTLAEKFGGEAVTRDLFESMVDFVLEAIEQFQEKDAIDEISKRGNVHLLGTSGTVTTLAGIHLKLPRYDRRQVDGLWMDDSSVDVIIDELLEMSYEERAANPCIGNDRADLVLAGCAILNAIRKTWPSDRLRVADRGLREGMLSEMMSKDRAWIYPKKNRWSRKRRKKRSEMQRKGEPS